MLGEQRGRALVDGLIGAHCRTRWCILSLSLTLPHPGTLPVGLYPGTTAVPGSSRARRPTWALASFYILSGGSFGDWKTSTRK